MEEICGKITVRGKRCVNPKSKCIHHQILKRKLYPPSLDPNFADRSICGVETTGHSQNGAPCQKYLKKGEEYCIYHMGVLFDSKSVNVAHILAEWC